MAPLSWSSSRVQAGLMGVVFLLTFAAYDTIQVYAKRLYPGNLGINMTFAIYVTFTCTEMFAPTVVNKLGARLAMGIGVLGYASIVIAGLIFFETGNSPAIVLCSGVLCGLGAGLLWTGQGRLILEYGKSGDRGTIFSIFWSFYRLASVSGGLLSYTYFSLDTSGNAGSTGLYLIFLALVLLGSLGTGLLKDPKDIDHGPQGQDAEGEALTRADSDHETTSCSGELLNTLRMFRSTPMLLLSMMFWSSGAIEPYILSGFTNRWFEKRTTGMEMVFFFSLSILGSMFTGRLLDRFSARGQERAGGLLALGLFSAVHGVGFVGALIVEGSSDWDRQYDFNDPQIVLPTIAFVMFGLSDSMINTFLYWLIGLLYSDGGERSHAIAFFKFLNSAAHVVGYAILPIDRVAATDQLWYNIALYFVGVPMAAYVTSKVSTVRKEPVDVAAA